MRTKRFRVVIDKNDKWYIGSSPDVPGALTQGRTIQEVKENMKEAILMILAAEKKHPRRIKTPLKTEVEIAV